MRLSGAIFLSALLTGCGFTHYQPKPIAPLAMAQGYARRSLDSPALRRALQRVLGPMPHWPVRVWTPRRLTAAALFYNPQLAAARAELPIARAAITTAAEKPNPSVSLSPGLETFAESPWAIDLSAVLPIETGGKRAARIRVARSAFTATRWRIAEAAWTVRGAVRSGLLAFMTARRRVTFLAQQFRRERERARLLGQRLQAGEIGRPALLAAQRRATQTQLALEEARGAAAAARADLARALGVPTGDLRQRKFAWPGFHHPPAPPALPLRALRRRALLNRLDLREALAQYQTAQAQLQEQIALQYPNLNLGPGYTYEEAASIFKLALQMSLPVRNRNQGPIAEAAARRDQLAAAFMALQAQDRAELDRAWANYCAAWSAYRLAGRDFELAQAQQRAVQRARAQGAAGALALNAARIQTGLGAQARRQALEQLQAALGGVEAAVQEPLSPEWRLDRNGRKALRSCAPLRRCAHLRREDEAAAADRPLTPASRPMEWRGCSTCALPAGGVDSAAGWVGLKKPSDKSVTVAWAKP